MDATERPLFTPELLSVVVLKEQRECEGKMLPAGATGAVVYAYRDGAGYEVEFTEPFHCVLTVYRNDIRPI
jgi:hypothetical protein